MCMCLNVCTQDRSLLQKFATVNGYHGWASHLMPRIEVTRKYFWGPGYVLILWEPDLATTTSSGKHADKAISRYWGHWLPSSKEQALSVCLPSSIPQYTDRTFEICRNPWHRCWAPLHNLQQPAAGSLSPTHILDISHPEGKFPGVPSQLGMPCGLKAMSLSVARQHIYFQITMCYSALRLTTESKLDSL